MDSEVPIRLNITSQDIAAQNRFHRSFFIMTVKRSIQPVFQNMSFFRRKQIQMPFERIPVNAVDGTVRILREIPWRRK